MVGNGREPKVSILELDLPEPEQVLKVLETMSPVLETELEKLGVTDRKVIKKMAKGYTAAQAMGIGQEQLDAFFELARRYMATAQFEKARYLYLYLAQIDPLEARNFYGLAMSYQVIGNYKLAARIYLIFLGMDATNSQGYLRLGECLIAAKEFNEANEAFEMAIKLFKDPVKDYQGIQYAQSMKRRVLQQVK